MDCVNCADYKGDVWKMNFTKWLKEQSGRDDAIGELARNVKRDDTWPNNAKSFSVVYGYLMHVGVHTDTLATLQKAWREYPGRVGTGPND